MGRNVENNTTWNFCKHITKARQERLKLKCIYCSNQYEEASINNQFS